MAAIEGGAIEDKDARYEMWEGRVPVAFHLSQTEVTDIIVPEPLHMLLPRMGYIHLCADEIRDHFLSATPSRADELWFEANGVPLKWTVPFGVLFDLINIDNQLPWKITVHFQGFPAAKLLRCKGKDDIRRHFINSFKEAIYLQFDSPVPLQCLKSDDQRQLWDSVLQAKYSIFQPISERILSGRRSERIPIRVFIGGFGTPFDFRPIQRPFNAASTDGSRQTLSYFLRSLLPGIMNEKSQSDHLAVIVHGLKVSMDTPLRWLVDHCSHADHFLYISVVKKS